MTDKEQRESDQVNAQIARHLKQAELPFWKVGILLVVVTAAVVQALNIWLG